MLQRPGHEQCMPCHSDDFTKVVKQVLCAQCHTKFPPAGRSDLVAFPCTSRRAPSCSNSRTQNTWTREPASMPRPASEPTARRVTNLKRTVCSRLSQPIRSAQSATLSRDSSHKLTSNVIAENCRGCHSPEEIENPGFTENRRLVSRAIGHREIREHQVYPHRSFQSQDQFNLNCTTCHSAIPHSTGLANLTLPMMIDCVQCHDAAKDVPAAFRMSNCTTCHNDPVNGTMPASHTVNVKPDFHTEVFRQHHAAEAAAADAKCFVCHQNVSPSMAARNQCDRCHAVMRPRPYGPVEGRYSRKDRRARPHYLRHMSTYGILQRLP